MIVDREISIILLIGLLGVGVPSLLIGLTIYVFKGTPNFQRRTTQLVPSSRTMTEDLEKGRDRRESEVPLLEDGDGTNEDNNV